MKASKFMDAQKAFIRACVMYETADMQAQPVKQRLHFLDIAFRKIVVDRHHMGGNRGQP